MKISPPNIRRILRRHTSAAEAELDALTTFIAAILQLPETATRNGSSTIEQLGAAATKLTSLATVLGEFTEYLHRRRLAETLVSHIDNATRDHKTIVDLAEQAIQLGQYRERHRKNPRNSESATLTDQRAENNSLVTSIEIECDEQHEPFDAASITNFAKRHITPLRKLPSARFYIHAEFAAPILLNGITSKSIAVLASHTISEARALMQRCDTAHLFHVITLHDHLPALIPNIVYVWLTKNDLDSRKETA